LVEEQGLLGLVEEEDGVVGLVEEAEGFVRVVCPNASPEINERAAVAARIARMFAHFMFAYLSNRISGGRSFRHMIRSPTIPRIS
jgi:hypothetical protein